LTRDELTPEQDAGHAARLALTMDGSRALFAMFLLAACGGTTPAKTEEPAPTSTPAAAPAPEHKPAGKPLGQLREEFMTKCGESMPTPDYCQCSWDVMAKMYTVEEMNSENVEPAKMQAYKGQAIATCAGKLPEGAIKTKFSNSCAGDRKKLVPYCDCAWTELRKQLSVGDLANDDTATTPRFVAAKKAMTKVCGGKMPEDVPRDDFYRGCSKDDPQRRPFCECVWKTMRATLSPAQIVGASPEDLEPFKPKIATACAPLVKK
jgi:hypothetical protein